MPPAFVSPAVGMQRDEGVMQYDPPSVGSVTALAVESLTPLLVDIAANTIPLTPV